MSGASINFSRIQAVTELYSAIRDRRIEDMLALVDLDVTCNPLARPGISTYYGHGGMIQFASDLHTTHGDFQLELDKVAEDDDSKVTVTATIFSEPGHAGTPLTITTVYTFRGDLIYSVESQPGTSQE